MVRLRTVLGRPELASWQHRGLLPALGLAILIHVLFFWGLAAGPSRKLEVSIPVLHVELRHSYREQAPPTAQPPSIQGPSNQRTIEAKPVQEREKPLVRPQPVERNTSLSEQQRREEQETREMRDSKKNCLGLEEQATSETPQMDINGKPIFRDPCVQG